jgi:hypothetical protein
VTLILLRGNNTAEIFLMLRRRILTSGSHFSSELGMFFGKRQEEVSIDQENRPPVSRVSRA